MKQSEKEFKRLVKKWKSKLLLQDWSIYVEFSAVDHKEAFSASSHVNARYHSATLTIFPIGVKDKHEYEEIIIHELIHIVLGELSRSAENRWEAEENYLDKLEQTVERIVRIIGNLATTSRSPDKVS